VCVSFLFFVFFSACAFARCASVLVYSMCYMCAVCVHDNMYRLCACSCLFVCCCFSVIWLELEVVVATTTPTAGGAMLGASTSFLIFLSSSNTQKNTTKPYYTPHISFMLLYIQIQSIVGKNEKIISTTCTCGHYEHTTQSSKIRISPQIISALAQHLFLFLLLLL
jgi:hypothetical protein